MNTVEPPRTKLSTLQKTSRQFLLLFVTISIFYFTYRYGHSICSAHGMKNNITFLPLFIVPVVIIIATRFIGKAFGILTALVVAFFDTLYGWPIELEMAGQPGPNPIEFFGSILLWPVMLLLLAKLIGSFVKPKYEG